MDAAGTLYDDMMVLVSTRNLSSWKLRTREPVSGEDRAWCAVTDFDLDDGKKLESGSSIENWQDVGMKFSVCISDLLSCLRKFKQGHSNNLRLVRRNGSNQRGWAELAAGFINRNWEDRETKSSMG